MKISIIGGGLAGSEAAWQVAERGVHVDLFEMRPRVSTGAHQTGNLAELVCSNSLGSNLPDRASGLLKEELRKLNSLLIACADASSLPAGGALAVDREAFSVCVQAKISSHPGIRIIREEVTSIPEGPAIIASGPLTSPGLTHSFEVFTGQDQLYFFDAIAPIVEFDSINMDKAFRANRYGRGTLDEGDYINCPFNQSEYFSFRNALIEAERIPLKSFEEDVKFGVKAGSVPLFQGCQPVEIIASRGEKALAFGPMRPVGLVDPRTGRQPFAVVQLRQDNLLGDLYNLVGFQTNLRYSEQKRVFRMIPGLEEAKFVRYGHMHRNSFVAAPLLVNENLAFKKRRDLFIAGQLAGIEGYVGNIASGLVAGINAVRYMHSAPSLIFPQTTMLGALIHYIIHAEIDNFQPMKAMFGLIPKPDDELKRSKRLRYAFYVDMARSALEEILPEV